MKLFSLKAFARLAVLTLVLACVPLALAQGGDSGGAATSRTTTTTTTTKPSRWVDPVWLAVGGVGLIALIAIVALAARGRGRDRVATTVHERETIIKD
ncbi:MAG TPA: hypothetical protein VGV38_04735 [Pyrinomonadaceae bacterium]|nr:hypothetical protein [Pyrinomonadaceae bacterium]